MYARSLSDRTRSAIQSESTPRRLKKILYLMPTKNLLIRARLCRGLQIWLNTSIQVLSPRSAGPLPAQYV